MTSSLKRPWQSSPFKGTRSLSRTAGPPPSHPPPYTPLLVMSGIHVIGRVWVSVGGGGWRARVCDSAIPRPCCWFVGLQIFVLPPPPSPRVLDFTEGYFLHYVEGLTNRSWDVVDVSKKDVCIYKETYVYVWENRSTSMHYVEGLTNRSWGVVDVSEKYVCMCKEAFVYVWKNITTSLHNANGLANFGWGAVDLLKEMYVYIKRPVYTYTRKQLHFALIQQPCKSKMRSVRHVKRDLYEYAKRPIYMYKRVLVYLAVCQQPHPSKMRCVRPFIRDQYVNAKRPIYMYKRKLVYLALCQQPHEMKLRCVTHVKRNSMCICKETCMYVSIKLA